MAAAAILKIEESPYIGKSLTDRHYIWRSDVVRPSWPFKPLKCPILKIQDGGGRRLEKNRKITIYLSVSLTDCHEIWHADAARHP